MVSSFDENSITTSEEDNNIIIERIGYYTFKLSLSEDDFNINKKTLFATVIWEGSRALSMYLIENKERIVGKSILEFGAGVGLPSLVCFSLGGTRLITATDYPAPSVIFNLKENVNRNTLTNNVLDNNLNKNKSSVYVIEHEWGTDVHDLLIPLQSKDNETDIILYDIIIASECLWKADTHESFITSIKSVLKVGGSVFLSFSHHIPGKSFCFLVFEILHSFLKC